MTVGPTGASNSGSNPFGEDPLQKHAADVDISWDALHHTIGAGATQAAAGNHKHPEYNTEGGVSDHGALTGLGDDDHSKYPLTNGTRATGTWPINISGNAATSTRTGAGNRYFSTGTISTTTTASGTVVVNPGRTIENTVIALNGDWSAHQRDPQCDGWSATNFTVVSLNASSVVRINWIVT